MSKVCDLTGKKPITGNHVSHSNRKTKRRFYPNLQTKKFYMPETGEWVTLKVSASAIRTISDRPDARICAPRSRGCRASSANFIISAACARPSARPISGAIA